MQSVASIMRRVFQIRNAVGLTLFLAGMAKFDQLWRAESMSDSMISRAVLPYVVVLELGLASWLFSAIRPRLCAAVTLAVLVVFACVALLHGVRGNDSCGCFGATKVNPWLMLAYDMMAASLLTASIRHTQDTETAIELTRAPT